MKTAKKLLAMLMAVLMLCTVLTLASCSDETQDSEDTKVNNEAKNEEKNENKGDNGDEQAPSIDNNGATQTYDKLNGKTPKELYEEARANTLALTEYELNGYRESTNTYPGSEAVGAKINFITVIKGESGYTKMTREFIGSDEPNMVNEGWYVDGTAYLNENGAMSTEPEETFDNFKQYYTISIDGDFFLDSKDFNFENKTLTKEGELYVLTLEMNSEEVKNYMKEQNVPDSMKILDGSLKLTLKFNADGTLVYLAGASTVVATTDGTEDIANARKANSDFEFNIVKTKDVTVPELKGFNG